MNENVKSQEAVAQERFWEAYRGCAEENRVAPDHSRYYVKWVKDFVNFLAEKRLKARTARDTRILNRPGLSVKSPADI